MFSLSQLILMTFLGTFSAPLLSISYNYYLAKDYRVCFKLALITFVIVFLWFFIILELSEKLNLSALIFHSNIIAFSLSWFFQNQLFSNQDEAVVKRSVLDVIKVILIGMLVTFLCVFTIKFL